MEDQFGNIERQSPQLREGRVEEVAEQPTQPMGRFMSTARPSRSGRDRSTPCWPGARSSESLDVCAEVEAAWLHHRFTRFIPFRTAMAGSSRAGSAPSFLKADYLVLVIRDEEHREPYLDALEAADKGDLKPLVDLFADVQRSDLQEALKTIRSLRGEESVQAIEAAAAAARQSQDATVTRVAGALDDLIGGIGSLSKRSQRRRNVPSSRKALWFPPRSPAATPTRSRGPRQILEAVGGKVH